MAKDYVPVNQHDSDNEERHFEHDNRRSSILRSRKSHTILVLCAILVLSLLLNIVSLGRGKDIFKHHPTQPVTYAAGHEVPTVYKAFWWDIEYNSNNSSEQDALWEAILPSHGFVAIDRKWAMKNRYPESMRLPQDASKGVYLLQAYHELHCLKILRLSMSEALVGKKLTWPDGHIKHCFSALLQSTICNADSTPLYSFGDDTAGHGQLHKCRDWNALRDYATEYKACYRDTIEDVLLKEHFGYCDEGSDGLIEMGHVEMHGT